MKVRRSPRIVSETKLPLGLPRPTPRTTIPFVVSVTKSCGRLVHEIAPPTYMNTVVDLRDFKSPAQPASAYHTSFRTSVPQLPIICTFHVANHSFGCHPIGIRWCTDASPKMNTLAAMSGLMQTETHSPDFCTACSFSTEDCLPWSW